MYVAWSLVIVFGVCEVVTESPTTMKHSRIEVKWITLLDNISIPASIMSLMKFYSLVQQ